LAFGLGLGAVVPTGECINRRRRARSVNEWDGESGCYFVVDRKQDMFS